jgi:hypothetical protein
MHRHQRICKYGYHEDWEPKYCWSNSQDEPKQLPHLPFQVLLHPIRTSLVQSLQERLSHKVDVLIFNPPYVPTDEVEAASAQGSQDISGAWAGGTDGMYLTDRLLEQVDVSDVSTWLPYQPFPITESSARAACGWI